jgi:hypothetical protein
LHPYNTHKLAFRSK